MSISPAKFIATTAFIGLCAGQLFADQIRIGPVDTRELDVYVHRLVLDLLDSEYSDAALSSRVVDFYQAVIDGTLEPGAVDVSLLLEEFHEIMTRPLGDSPAGRRHSKDIVAICTLFTFSEFGNTPHYMQIARAFLGELDDVNVQTHFVTETVDMYFHVRRRLRRDTSVSDHRGVFERYQITIESWAARYPSELVEALGYYDELLSRLQVVPR